MQINELNAEQRIKEVKTDIAEVNYWDTSLTLLGTVAKLAVFSSLFLPTTTKNFQPKYVALNKKEMCLEAAIVNLLFSLIKLSVQVFFKQKVQSLMDCHLFSAELKQSLFNRLKKNQCLATFSLATDWSVGTMGLLSIALVDQAQLLEHPKGVLLAASLLLISGASIIASTFKIQQNLTKAQEEMNEHERHLIFEPRGMNQHEPHLIFEPRV